MSFLQNLFGTIAGEGIISRVRPNIDFIPVDGSGGTIDISGKEASWLGLKNRVTQKYAYEYCFAVASVVDRLAEADLTGTLEILRKNGKGKDDYATTPWATRMNARFEQPNPLQSWEEFRGQQVVYKKVFGFCPVLPLIPTGFEDRSFCMAMLNIPPWLFKATGTKKLINQTKIEEIVKEYEVTLLGETIKLTTEQIFILNDSFMQSEADDFLLPQSKLVGLDMAVSNLCAAMEADNVLLKKRGPLGFISHDAAAVKDSVAGYIPMSTTEKKELQDALAQYGMSLQQFQYVISRQAVKFNPMSYNVAELGTKATIVASEQAICHRYGYDYILYESSGAKYANQNGAEKGLYQNNVIPNNTKDMNKYNKFFKAAENNAVIGCDYTKLPVLQENKQEAAQARGTLDNALKIEYEADVITLNQWRTAQGLETITGGDIYFSEIKKPEPVMPPPIGQTLPTNEDPSSQDQSAAA